ncbi:MULTISPECIES: amino acid ABC transporter permease [Thermomonospora]|uniref:Polar amino acid ABC transporter, inner membrane subunit n=1 Tax=Thermomonospora curvata (strain ATCC 19995 / DSM 43183 / JCM 3096 / KCTC 9072 / NBRC 15933 / NCIMB 10081 / Henssen B9) TaxID=471852 RepID=D1AAB4_THECD|nr:MULTISPECIES: amino acid ABC transporter permease [Thermomonospora]ACY98827.1 polar amino acid ABC transporter, inner membrane subunit [Thermomonospora curvata DSM 43183]PKK13037.1 MAG: amino acid ABC transporter permease [Thermomonospora sp. CIF 1]
MDQLLDFGPVFDNLDLILGGFWATIRIAVVTAVLSLIFGTFLAALRVSPVPVLRHTGGVVVNTLRNTPLTLVLAICIMAVNDTLQVRLAAAEGVNRYWWGVLGLSIYTSAFVCEALRSGINTVPIGQAEAARSIGLTFTQSLRLVILPQAFRAVIAPLGSVMIAMIKNTTVVGAVAYGRDAAAVMKDMFDDLGASIPIFVGIAIGYMILTLPTGFFFGWLAKRMAVAR